MNQDELKTGTPQSSSHVYEDCGEHYISERVKLK